MKKFDPPLKLSGVDVDHVRLLFTEEIEFERRSLSRYASALADAVGSARAKVLLGGRLDAKGRDLVDEALITQFQHASRDQLETYMVDAFEGDRESAEIFLGL